MNAVIYTLITQHYATLKELRDDYDIEETLDLYEACCVSMHNKIVSIENGKEK